MRSLTSWFLALISSAAIAASPDHGLEALFSAKKPWQFPKLESSPELKTAIDQATQDYRTVDARLKLRSSGIYHDPQRGLVFLTFEIAPDSPVFMTDFFLVYIYDPSAHHMLGHVRINMA